VSRPIHHRSVVINPRRWRVSNVAVVSTRKMQNTSLLRVLAPRTALASAGLNKQRPSIAVFARNVHRSTQQRVSLNVSCIKRKEDFAKEQSRKYRRVVREPQHAPISHLSGSADSSLVSWPQIYDHRMWTRHRSSDRFTESIFSMLTYVHIPSATTRTRTSFLLSICVATLRYIQPCQCLSPECYVV
jgi:hypothetical protein